jgi:hypothetical protein
MERAEVTAATAARATHSHCRRLSSRPTASNSSRHRSTTVVIRLGSQILHSMTALHSNTTTTSFPRILPSRYSGRRHTTDHHLLDVYSSSAHQRPERTLERRNADRPSRRPPGATASTQHRANPLPHQNHSRLCPRTGHERTLHDGIQVRGQSTLYPTRVVCRSRPLASASPRSPPQTWIA